MPKAAVTASAMDTWSVSSTEASRRRPRDRMKPATAADATLTLNTCGQGDSTESTTRAAVMLKGDVHQRVGGGGGEPDKGVWRGRVQGNGSSNGTESTEEGGLKGNAWPGRGETHLGWRWHRHRLPEAKLGLYTSPSRDGGCGGWGLWG